MNSFKQCTKKTKKKGSIICQMEECRLTNYDSQQGKLWALQRLTYHNEKTFNVNNNVNKRNVCGIKKFKLLL